VEPDLKVWSVTVDLEYAVDFTMPQSGDPTSPGQDLSQEGLRQADAGSQTTPDVWEDPIGSGQWYHRDEAEQAHGPFPGWKEAYEALRAYAASLDGPPSSGQEAAPDLSSAIKPE
jgi:hypothetical protein